MLNDDDDGDDNDDDDDNDASNNVEVLRASRGESDESVSHGRARQQ